MKFLQDSCKNPAKSHKNPQDPTGSCNILQDLAGVQEKGPFLARSCKSVFTGCVVLMNYVAYRIPSLVSQMHGYLFIVCHAELSLAQADKIALHPVPHLSALLEHVQTEQMC